MWALKKFVFYIFTWVPTILDFPSEFLSKIYGQQLSIISNLCVDILKYKKISDCTSVGAKVVIVTSLYTICITYHAINSNHQLKVIRPYRLQLPFLFNFPLTAVLQELYSHTVAARRHLAYYYHAKCSLNHIADHEHSSSKLSSGQCYKCLLYAYPRTSDPNFSVY